MSDIVERLRDEAKESETRCRCMCHEAAAEIERLRARVAELEADREWFTGEWQRLRATLNAIAWGADVHAVEIARDTLAIGTKSANERASKAARADNWEVGQ